MLFAKRLIAQVVQIFLPNTIFQHSSESIYQEQNAG
jgi:hypothetical protein